MRASAPPWADVKLRLEKDAEPIEVGTELVTEHSGRRYQVIGVNGRTLHCLVLPPEAPTTGPVISWRWTARNKRREP